MLESNNNNITSIMERLKSRPAIIAICSVICLVVIGVAIGLGVTAQPGSSNDAAEQATVDKAIVTEDNDAEAHFFEEGGANVSAAGNDEDGEETDADDDAQNEMGANDAGTSDNLTSETFQGTSRANTSKSVTNTGSSQGSSDTSASLDSDNTGSANVDSPSASNVSSSAEPSNGNSNTAVKPSNNASNGSSAKPESSASAPAHVHSWVEYETIIEQGRYETVDKGTTRPMLYVYDASGNLSNQFLPGNVKEAQDWADMVGGRVESVQVKNTVTNWYSPKYEYGKKCSCGEKIVEGTRGGTKTCIGGYA